jgi:hypothetical protein
MTTMPITKQPQVRAYDALTDHQLWWIDFPYIRLIYPFVSLSHGRRLTVAEIATPNFFFVLLHVPTFRLLQYWFGDYAQKLF